VWDEEGLLTVTGGSSRPSAHALRRTPGGAAPVAGARGLSAGPGCSIRSAPGCAEADALDDDVRRRLIGSMARSGTAGVRRAAGRALRDPGCAHAVGRAALGCARRSVVHLDDLLLRRVRLGLLLPDGARDLLPDVRRICRGRAWMGRCALEREADAYLRIWRDCYNVPAEALVAARPAER